MKRDVDAALENALPLWVSPIGDLGMDPRMRKIIRQWVTPVRWRKDGLVEVTFEGEVYDVPARNLGITHWEGWR